MGAFSQLLGDIASFAGRGIEARIADEIGTQGDIRRQSRLFHAGKPLREAARKEEYEAGRPLRKQLGETLGPVFEREGVIPPVATGEGGAIPPGYEYLREIDPRVADYLLRVQDIQARKQRSEASDIWKYLAHMRGLESLQQGQQRINLSTQPPPAAEEDLQLKASRFLSAHGIDDLHPDFPRLLNSVVEGLRGGQEIRVIEREEAKEETKQPSLLERIMGGVPYPVTKRSKVKDIEVGPQRGGRTRPATRPQPVGGAGKAKPQIPQPSVPLKPAEEKALNRYRYVPGKGLVVIGQ